MRVTSTTMTMPRVTRASAQARTAAPKPSGRPSCSPQPDPASSSSSSSDRTSDQGQGQGKNSGQDQAPGEEKPKTVKDYLMKLFQMLVQQVMDDANEELEKLEKRLKENTQKLKELARDAPR